METVGERLNSLIKTLNIKKVDFAKDIDRSTGNVSDWLNNKCKPGKRALKIINEKYDVSINWLLYGKGHMFEENKIISEQENNYKNIFSDSEKVTLTANYGTGKSFMINSLIELFKKDKELESLPISSQKIVEIADYINSKIGQTVQSEQSYVLTEEEIRIIELFRQLDDKNKIKIEGMLEIKVAESQCTQKTTSSSYQNGEDAATYKKGTA